MTRIRQYLRIRSAKIRPIRVIRVPLNWLVLVRSVSSLNPSLLPVLLRSSPSAPPVMNAAAAITAWDMQAIGERRLRGTILGHRHEKLVLALGVRAHKVGRHRPVRALSGGRSG